jgi:hypothetical protein
MTADIRWRVISLQVVALLVLVFGAIAGFYASNFTATTVHDQLAPQQIFFPPNEAAGLPANLSQYAGQQVLTGPQARAYAQDFIGLHLKEIGQGHPYSYWSGLALQTTDPVAKLKYQAIADTMFKGTTLQSLLNEAYAFSVFGQIAFWAGIGLSIAALVVLGALIFEFYSASRAGSTETAAPTSTRSSAQTTDTTGTPASDRPYATS